jgi:plasmid maintenance system antidote protein VapI
MSAKKKPAKISPAELAGEIFQPRKLTPAQKKEADRQLAEARKKSQLEMTEETRMQLRLWQLRFWLDDYIESKKYNPQKTFGYFLKEYVDRLNIKQKAFAEEISIDETLLSQLINEHRLPPDYLAIRLEIHSNKIIPANFWYKLVEKEKEHFIKTDKEIRRKEKKFVHTKTALSL